MNPLINGKLICISMRFNKRALRSMRGALFLLIALLLSGCCVDYKINYYSPSKDETCEESTCNRCINLDEVR